MAAKKLNSIFLLYHKEGFLEGFALTEKEAQERGYVTSVPFNNRPFYKEFSR
jgi:hypothetical protein